MSEQFTVLILGYGEMGHAMEFLLKGRCRLLLWEKFPEEGFQSVALDEVAPEADIVLFCLPVNPHLEIAEKIKLLLKKNCINLSIAKGLDEAGQTAAQIFSDVFSSNQYGLLYGPMISEEIRAGRYSFAQLGSTNSDLSSKVCSLFQDTGLYIESSTDITGISWSVVLKNVYALVFGMADELKLGDNLRGYLTMAALRELDAIVHKMGGDVGTPYNLAGLGDLITTATSEDSHHHELGRLLAREETESIQGEGVHTLEMITKFSLFNTDDYPLFKLIQQIVENPQNVADRIQQHLRQVYS